MAKEPKEEKTEDEQESTETKKGGSKLIIIIVAIVCVSIAIGVGAFFALGGKGEKASKGEGEEAAAEKTEEAAAESEGGEGGKEGGAAEANLFPLEPFIVNLQVKGSFLKVDVQLEFVSAEEIKKCEKQVPRLRDAIIQVLSSKTSSEILPSEGKEKLKDEIREVVNSTLGGNKVVEVYFTEFIIQ